MISTITIGGVSYNVEIISIQVSTSPIRVGTPAIRVGNKVTASWQRGREFWEVTGFVTKIDGEAFWLNEVRFPKTSCNFKLA